MICITRLLDQLKSGIVLHVWKNLQNLHAIDSLARHANFNPLLFCLWRWRWHRLGFIIRFYLPNWKRLDPLDANEAPFAGIVMPHKAHSTQIILFVVCIGVVE